MMFKSMAFEIRDRVAYVTFTMPQRLNSVDEQRLAELDALVTALEGNGELVAVVFTGQGKAFCVGLDKDLLRRAFDDMDYFRDVIRRYNGILNRIEELPMPTIAAVNGYARAGGIELALACDLILIADDAKIGDNHTHYGVMPGGGSTQRLPRRVGEQRAKELIWSARWLDADEAVACGLALQSIPAAALAEGVEDFLREFRNKPRAVLEVVKRTMHGGRDLSVRDGVEVEIAAFGHYMAELPFAREGYTASMEGRDPSWLVENTGDNTCTRLHSASW
jgi:enoyl-CoA hydratase/carnithine racemase